MRSSATRSSSPSLDMITTSAGTPRRNCAPIVFAPDPCDAPRLTATFTPVAFSNSGCSFSNAAENPPDVMTFTCANDGAPRPTSAQTNVSIFEAFTVISIISAFPQCPRGLAPLRDFGCGLREDTRLRRGDKCRVSFVGASPDTQTVNGRSRISLQINVHKLLYGMSRIVQTMPSLLYIRRQKLPAAREMFPFLSKFLLLTTRNSCGRSCAAFWRANRAGMYSMSKAARALSRSFEIYNLTSWCWTWSCRR